MPTVQTEPLVEYLVKVKGRTDWVRAVRTRNIWNVPGSGSFVAYGQDVEDAVRLDRGPLFQVDLVRQLKDGNEVTVRLYVDAGTVAVHLGRDVADVDENDVQGYLADIYPKYASFDDVDVWGQVRRLNEAELSGLTGQPSPEPS